MKKEIIIPYGTKVRVLDTPNVRKYRKDAIGYEFVTDSVLYKDGAITSPGNNYSVNYREGDFLVLDTIINNYSIY